MHDPLNPNRAILQDLKPHSVRLNESPAKAWRNVLPQGIERGLKGDQSALLSDCLHDARCGERILQSNVIADVLKVRLGLIRDYQRAIHSPRSAAMR